MTTPQATMDQDRLWPVATEMNRLVEKIFNASSKIFIGMRPDAKKLMQRTVITSFEKLDRSVPCARERECVKTGGLRNAGGNR